MTDEKKIFKPTFGRVVTPRPHVVTEDVHEKAILNPLPPYTRVRVTAGEHVLTGRIREHAASAALYGYIEIELDPAPGISNLAKNTAYNRRFNVYPDQGWTIEILEEAPKPIRQLQYFGGDGLADRDDYA